MQLSHSKDKSNPEVIVSKAQAKADHWHRRAHDAFAMVFDMQFPAHRDSDIDVIKAMCADALAERKTLIKQRDDLKETVRQLRSDLGAAKALLRTQLNQEDV